MSAETQLQAAVEELYRQLARYPLRGLMDACPCCITPAENAVLMTVPLRQLGEEQIGRYAFKALSTWGDAADFRHFLPRILELKARDELSTDFFVLRGKLEQCDYHNWPEPEQAAVRAVLLASLGWQWTHHFIALHDLGAMLDLVGGIAPVLARWTLGLEGRSFENLAYLAANYLPDLNEGGYWAQEGFPPAVVAALNRWFRQQLPVLEAGFFRWADEQPALAALASEAYEVVSGLPPE
jgi:hypothetical protein